MDLLNNLNVIVGIIVSFITIGTTIWGIVKYLQKKAVPAQTVQAMQPSSSNQILSQPTYKPLSRLDWMEVLWCGLEDSFRARESNGVIVSFVIGFLVLMCMGISSAPIIAFVVFITLFILVNLVFYTYFVGRRVEKKIEDINKNSVQKMKSQRGY